ncbi:protein SUPPRESSOR OF K(+) TRANSPORT GROWTH DEFECT 1-like [Bidens hawaiensis]|uniref:protein SUPPRESSOR OF K(+) TRANSPORT GROWTH DEFECT 1-like n=1 Tax=Bidens hawaiensis TaxID=980011 RepID=UPI00404B9680
MSIEGVSKFKTLGVCLVRGKRQPWRTFLLYGPPGTGKSYLAKAVATEAYSTFFSVSSSDLASTRVQESEKVVSNLFRMARKSKPSDIRKRFDKCIYIPLPDSKARKHIFKVHLGNTPNNLTESDFESLAHKTEGFSGSDIDVCVKDVLYEPIRKTQDATFFVKKTEGLWVPCGPKEPGAVQTTMQELAAQGLAEKISPPPVTQTDFDKVLARQKPTVNKSDLEVYERFTKEFGEKS